MNKIELILQESLELMEKAVEANNPHCANYWLVEYIKDLNFHADDYPLEDVMECAMVYWDYNKRIEKMFLDS